MLDKLIDKGMKDGKNDADILAELGALTGMIT